MGNRVLRMTATVFIVVRDGETQAQAEERLCSLLTKEGITILPFSIPLTSEIIEFPSDPDDDPATAK